MKIPKYEHIYPDYNEAELLQLPPRSSLDEEEKNSFDWVMAKLKGMHHSIPTLRDSDKGFRVPPLCTALLQSPQVAERWLSFSGFFQGMEARGSFNNRDREFVEQALNPLMGKRSRLRIADAVGCGISPHDIKAIWENRLDELAPEDRQLVEYVQATYRGELTPKLFEALAARMGTKTAVEYTAQITFKIGLMWTVQSMWNIQGQVSDNEGGEEMLQCFIDGEYEPHEYGRSGLWSEGNGNAPSLDSVKPDTTSERKASDLKAADYLMLRGPAGAKLLESANRVPTPERAAEMLKIDLEYSQCFFNGDFDGMLEILVDTPVYEFYPQAVRMTGKDAARARAERGYTSTIGQVDPRKNEDTREYRALAYGENVMVGETTALFTLPDGTKKHCSYIAVIEFDGDKMVGERVYSDHYHASMRDQKFGGEFSKLPGVTML